MKYLLLLTMVFGLVACKKTPDAPEKTLLGANAPSYSPQKGLNQFLLGEWALISAGKSGGLGASSNWKDAAKGDDGLGQTFTFSPGGKLEVKNGTYTVGGTWAVSGRTVNLSYSTLNGLPMETAIANIRKEAETGRQGAIASDIFVDWVTGSLANLVSCQVDEDGKRLTFQGDRPKVGNKDLEDMMAGLGTFLERVGTKPAK